MTIHHAVWPRQARMLDTHCVERTMQTSAEDFNKKVVKSNVVLTGEIPSKRQ